MQSEPKVTGQKQDKRRTTVYMSREVLEFLAVRRARGAGSVSEQLEALARKIMPRRYTQEDVAALERKHAEGYAKHPAEPGEFEVWEDELVWGDG